MQLLEVLRFAAVLVVGAALAGYVVTRFTRNLFIGFCAGFLWGALITTIWQ